MAARPTWRGVIKLALVSIPVEIYPATKSGKSIAFHQVHEPSGQAGPLRKGRARHRAGRPRRDPQGL